MYETFILINHKYCLLFSQIITPILANPHNTEVAVAAKFRWTRKAIIEPI